MEARIDIEAEGNFGDGGDLSKRILVAGLGGAGGEVLRSLAAIVPPEVRLVAINTDSASLETLGDVEQCLLGKKITRGLGTGGDLALGRKVAEAERDALDAVVAEAGMVISLTGLGGGAGTAMVEGLANAAVRADIPHLAFVFHPFTFEGGGRAAMAEEMVGILRTKVHGLVPIANDLILQLGDEDLPAKEAFAKANAWIVQALNALFLMVFKTGIVNQDLNSLIATLGQRGGRTLFGVGRGEGPSAVSDVVQSLLDCPLLQVLNEDTRRVNHLLIQITGGDRLGLAKINQLMSRLRDHFSCQEDVRFGAVVDPAMGEAIELCVIGKFEMHSPSRAPVADGRLGLDLGGLGDDGGGGQSRKPTGTNGSGVPVHTSKLGSRSEKPRPAQEEFDFISDSAQRGLFEQTERTLVNGEDLDVPTYMRKGVRIKV